MGTRAHRSRLHEPLPADRGRSRRSPELRGNLCDRKEVTLEDQMSVLAKFYVFTSTHVAAHFTGIITDDFTSEFDPFSPAFGEKFSPANLPVSVKDWAGNEISRVYSDQWGIYNGLNYSTWAVNPPDPSGYVPTMMVMCMNDRGSGADRRILSTRQLTASSATSCRSCRGRPRTWTRRSYPRPPSRPATTIPTATTRMPRRRSAKWMAMELDRGLRGGTVIPSRSTRWATRL